MEKRRLLELIRPERAGGDRLVENPEPVQMEVPGASPAWSVKDIIVHTSRFERQMVGMLRAQVMAGSELRQLLQDRRNEAVLERGPQTALADVLAQAALVHQELVRELRCLEDHDLVEPARFPGVPADWQRWRVIAGSTYQHYRDHARDVRAWLAEQA